MGTLTWRLVAIARNCWSGRGCKRSANGTSTYRLVVEQQPKRARMCGFGDKDRRPITPPPCVKLVVTDLQGKEVDVKYALRHLLPLFQKKKKKKLLVLTRHLYKARLNTGCSSSTSTYGTRTVPERLTSCGTRAARPPSHPRRRRRMGASRRAHPPLRISCRRTASHHTPARTWAGTGSQACRSTACLPGTARRHHPTAKRRSRDITPNVSTSPWWAVQVPRP